MSKHVPFSDAATLQIIYNDTLQLWVSLGRLVPLLYSLINVKSNNNYHWILLVLNMETNNLVVFDFMRCPKDAIQHFLDPLNR